jgi:predicted RNA methylase
MPSAKRMRLPPLRRWELEELLRAHVPPFAAPRLELEQYPTAPDMATHMLLAAAAAGDVGPGRDVLDLGTGPGMLAVAAWLCGARRVLGVDVDEAALGQARAARAAVLAALGGGSDSSDSDASEGESADGSDAGSESDEEEPLLGSLDFLCSDVLALLPELPDAAAPSAAPAAGDEERAENALKTLTAGCADCVITNPPFGCRSEGADMRFLAAAAHLTRRTVYSLHKSSTRAHVLREAERRLGLRGRVVAELRWALPRTYRHQRAASKDIAVDFIRFELLLPADHPRPGGAMPRRGGR